MDHVFGAIKLVVDGNNAMMMWVQKESQMLVSNQKHFVVNGIYKGAKADGTPLEYEYTIDVYTSSDVTQEAVDNGIHSYMRQYGNTLNLTFPDTPPTS